LLSTGNADRHFPTKDQLVVAFLEAQAVVGRTDLLTFGERDGPRAVLAAVLAGVQTEFSREGFRGCESINTAAEFSDPDHAARLVVAAHRDWIRRLMTDSLTQLGHPAPASTAEILLTLRTGAIVASSLEGVSDNTDALARTWWGLVDQRVDVSS
jgi:AcrR family transcriptional regulator